MNITIQGHNMKVSDAIEQYAQHKIDKLDRYLPNIADIRIDLSRQRTRRGANQSVAQITLRHGRGAILRTEERMSGDDRDTMQAAINSAVDKMYRQIRRFKDKPAAKRKKLREKYSITIEELALAEELPVMDEIAIETAMTEEEESVVRRKEVALSAMTEEEAIQQMELLGHDFFMFFNESTGNVSVLYRRGSGGYGVLVPSSEQS